MAPESLALGIPGLTATPIAAPLTEQEESTSAYHIHILYTLSLTYTFEHFCVHTLKSLTISPSQLANQPAQQIKKNTECPPLEHLNSF